MNFENWFVPELFDKHGKVIKFDYPTSKVICVGRNYVEHAKELNNPVPKKPILFLKPNSSVCKLTESLTLPSMSSLCHYETELALLIGDTVARNSSEISFDKIAGVGLALDLTLRDLQHDLKSNGKPWDKSKAFDRSCPVTPFHQLADEFDNMSFELLVNKELRQKASPKDMIFSIERLLKETSQYFTLYPGDILLTGTPKGVGELNDFDKLELHLQGLSWHAQVEYERVSDG